MLFASPSKFCLRRFFIFFTSEARFSALWFVFEVSSHNAFAVRTHTLLICYLLRKSMNLAHFAGFSGIILRGPDRSEIDRPLCR